MSTHESQGWTQSTITPGMHTFDLSHKREKNVIERIGNVIVFSVIGYCVVSFRLEASKAPTIGLGVLADETKLRQHALRFARERLLSALRQIEREMDC